MAQSTNLAGLRSYAGALRKSPEAAGKAAEIALNKGAEKARDLGGKQIIKELHLELPYVQKHLTVTKKASRGDLLAKISAMRRDVLLPRYGAALRTKKAKTPKRRLKGDPYRGIPRGRKSAGSKAFAVKRGRPRKRWENAFFFRGKNSGAWIMATRRPGDTGRKDFTVRYGPSVYQAWKNVRNDVTPKAMDVVEREFVKQFNRLV